ncbi:MAG: hypothetical protein FJ318_10080 [SAR202 cluster bacterium]|nr:hypothetical protein [SAR202 cluster bacterium]
MLHTSPRLLLLAALAAASACAPAQSATVAPIVHAATPRPGAITITVDVPADTPPEDAVFLQAGAGAILPMRRTGPRAWSLTVTREELAEVDGAAYDPATGVLRYAYTRGWGYLGAEASVDDHPDADWAEARRRTLRPGLRHHDTVKRCRWFPAAGQQLPRYEQPLSTWSPRVDGVTFQAGVSFPDAWNEWGRYLTASTAGAAREQLGATWALVSPRWDYRLVEPLPVLAESADGTAAAGDIALRLHLRQLKASGLRVVLAPRLCCVEPGGNRGDEWMRAWFVEYERFLTHHARIAQAERVDGLLIDWSATRVHGLPASAHGRSWYLGRWMALLKSVRQAFRGPVGCDLKADGAPDGYGLPWPWHDLRPIAGEFDFFGIANWAAVASSGATNQAEIDANTRSMFAASVDPIHRATGKPIVITAVAYGSYDGAAMHALDPEQVMARAFRPERGPAPVWDGLEQAMAVQGVMQAVSHRPHVVGVYPFLYQYVAVPLAPDYSVRGKPAERVLAHWYALAGGGG